MACSENGFIRWFQVLVFWEKENLLSSSQSPQNSCYLNPPQPLTPAFWSFCIETTMKANILNPVASPPIHHSVVFWSSVILERGSSKYQLWCSSKLRGVGARLGYSQASLKFKFCELEINQVVQFGWQLIKLVWAQNVCRCIEPSTLKHWFNSSSITGTEHISY